MDIAEQAAKDQKEEDIDYNFQYINAKNLTNLNATLTEEDSREVKSIIHLKKNRKKKPILFQIDYPQELRTNDDSFVQSEERYQAMVQPEEITGYQQDQVDTPEPTEKKLDETEEEEEEDETSEIEVGLLVLFRANVQKLIHTLPFQITDGSEKDPQASQIPLMDKTKLLLYPKRHFYNIPVNTNHSAVHVPSNVYDRCK